MNALASRPLSLGRAVVAAAIATIVGYAPAARAGSPSADDAARAEQLFQQAKALMAAKNYADACPKLAESQRLDPGTGTLLALALCHEAQGRFTTAWAEFRESIPAARAEHRSDRIAVATMHMARLEPKIARLVVHVSREASAAPNLSVRRDGETLAADAIDAPMAVDVGTHTIVATAAGREPWQARVAVDQEGKLYEVTVPLPAEMISASLTAPVPDATGAAAAPPSVDAPPSVPAQETPTLRYVAYGLVGVGVAGLAMGSVAGSIAIFDATKANTACPTTACTSPQAIQTNDEARASATISNVAFGVGILALGAGAALWLLTPSTQAGSLHAMAGPSGAFVAYDSRF